MPGQFKDDPLLYYDTLLEYHGIAPKGLPDKVWVMKIKAVQHFREQEDKPLNVLIKLLSS